MESTSSSKRCAAIIRRYRQEAAKVRVAMGNLEDFKSSLTLDKDVTFTSVLRGENEGQISCNGEPITTDMVRDYLAVLEAEISEPRKIMNNCRHKLNSLLGTEETVRILSAK
jgi:hypothetical protein